MVLGGGEPISSITSQPLQNPHSISGGKERNVERNPFTDGETEVSKAPWQSSKSATWEEEEKEPKEWVFWVPVCLNES